MHLSDVVDSRPIDKTSDRNYRMLAAQHSLDVAPALDKI